MIIRAIMNEYRYLIGDERFLQSEIKQISAITENGQFITTEEVISLIKKDYHIDYCFVDETVIIQEHFLELLAHLRKHLGEQVKIVPITKNKKLIHQLVQKQFNQFLYLDNEKSEQAHSFELFGLMMNPRTATDVEEFMLEQQPQETLQTVQVKERIIKQETLRIQLQKQKRIAFVGLIPQAGATTMAIEAYAICQQRGINAKLYSFDSKIAERFKGEYQLQNMEVFLNEVLQSWNEEVEYFIYDIPSTHHDVLNEYEMIFSEIYCLFDYNYPLLLEQAMIFEQFRNKKGCFVLNKHKSLPNIDYNLKRILNFERNTELNQLLCLDRDEIISAEIQRQAVANEELQMQLSELLDLPTAVKTPKRLFKWFHKKEDM
ncbi:MAG: hypothetical protein ACRC1D_01450 [Culicoidibacterales bacterium]